MGFKDTKYNEFAKYNVYLIIRINPLTLFISQQKNILILKLYKTHLGFPISFCLSVS